VVGAGATLYGTAKSVEGAKITAQAQRRRGEAEAAAARFQQDQLQIQADLTKTAAMQDEARRRTELTSALEHIAVMRAGRGLSVDSPTGRAITESTVERAEGDVATARLGYMTRADAERRAAIMEGQKAETSLLAGEMGASATIAGAEAQLFKTAGSLAIGLSGGKGGRGYL
jgi:hypothetical protein